MFQQCFSQPVADRMDSDRTACRLCCLRLVTFPFLPKSIVLFCSAGYTGLIFGFFGGIFYLYQKNVPRKESSIHSQWGRRKMVCSS